MSLEGIELQPPSGGITLVVTDSNFNRVVDGLEDYISKLDAILTKKGATMVTVSGKYGISDIRPDILALEVDDRNKTNFGQTLENLSGHFDEVLIITTGGFCNYLNAVNEVATDNNKTITKYGYPVKPK